MAICHGIGGHGRKELVHWAINGRAERKSCVVGVVWVYLSAPFPSQRILRCLDWVFCVSKVVDRMHASSSKDARLQIVVRNNSNFASHPSCT
jgi:hypothetical protein